MKKILLFVTIILLATIVSVMIEAGYPSSYSKLKIGMTENDAMTILSKDHFVFQETFGRHKNVWVRKQALGEWVLRCSFDKGKLWDAAFWYHVPGCGEYVRARASLPE